MEEADSLIGPALSGLRNAQRAAHVITPARAACTVFSWIIFYSSIRQLDQSDAFVSPENYAPGFRNYRAGAIAKCGPGSYDR